MSLCTWAELSVSGGTLMFFDEDDEPVAKFNGVEWLTVYRDGTTDWETYNQP